MDYDLPPLATQFSERQSAVAESTGGQSMPRRMSKPAEDIAENLRVVDGTGAAGAGRCD